MKTVLSLCLVALLTAPVHAEVYRSGVRGGHGHGHGHRDTRVHVGISYGTGHHYGHWAPYRHWDHRHHGYGSWGYYAPRYQYVPSYSYYGGYGYDYPYYAGTSYSGPSSAATNGLVLGAVAGGIIGHNSGEFRHNGWRGAAWGAGLGWLLGTVVDANRRQVTYQEPVVVQPAAAVQAQAAQTQAQPQQVTIINNYYNSPSPMSGANSLFGR